MAGGVWRLGHDGGACSSGPASGLGLFEVNGSGRPVLSGRAANALDAHVDALRRRLLASRAQGDPRSRTPNDSRWPASQTAASAFGAVVTDTRVILAGELDLVGAQILRAHETPEVTSSDRTIDIAGVSFVDAAGLGALVRLIAVLDQRPALPITGARREIARIFGLAGLASLLDPPDPL
jgi:anti-anti-sigma factor